VDDSRAKRYEFKSFKYSSHYWVLNFLSGEKGRLRILDVGASNGYLGASLRKLGHSVVGIEKDTSSAEEARRYYDSFHVHDIEDFDFSYRGEFDYMLFADILEHLRDPVSVLRRSLPSLKESGKIIVSMPNVANIIIRLSLLLGRFDYADRGILDQTHLRFYTRASLVKMLDEASYRVLELVPTPLPVQLVFPITEKKVFASMHELHYLLVRSWKTLFAYQFVVRATPRGRVVDAVS
jgi:O-antigen biosynthesis protein